jgi:hypothetical protein
MRIDVYVGTTSAGAVWGQSAGDEPTTIVLAGYDRLVSAAGFLGADGNVSPAIGVTAGDLVLFGFTDWPDDTTARSAPTGTSNTRVGSTPDGAGIPMVAGLAHIVAASTGTQPAATWGPTSGITPWLPQSVSLRVTDATPAPVEGKFVTTTDGRRFLDQDGEPVLLKGDSPWSAMANTTPAQWTTYCQYLASVGFNTIILDLVPLPAGGGPYVRAEAETYDGLKPFTTFGDWSTASGAYWTRVDQFVTTAETYGLSIAMVPAYASQGSPGSAADVLSGQTTTQIQGYGTFLGNRYKTAPNVIWVIGGDYGADLVGSPNNAAVWAEYVSAYNTLATAIGATGDTHLVTTHLYPPPSGTRYTGSTSADHTGLPIADFEFTYIYEPPYPVVRRALGLASHPVIFGEGNYSNENNQGGPSTTNETLRRARLWAYSSGVAGDFMGTEQWRGQAGWVSSIPRAAYTQAQAIHQAVESIPWWKLVPDASNVFLTSGQGTQPSSGTQDFSGVDPLESSYATASVATDGTVGVVYVPTARAFTVDLSKLGSTSRTLRRVDPTNGTSTSMTVSGSIASSGANASGDSDWLYLFQADPLVVSHSVSGTVAGTSTVSGAVTVRRSAAGTVVALSGAIGSVTSRHVASGSVAAVSSAAGSVTARLPVSGAVAAVFTVAGSVLGQGDVSGVISVVSGTFGAVTSRHVVSGTVAAVSSVSGAVTSDTGSTNLPVAGAVAASSSASGSVTARHVGAGIVAAVSTTNGAVTAHHTVAGTVASVSLVAGNVTGSGDIPWPSLLTLTGITQPVELAPADAPNRTLTPVEAT